MRKVVIERYAGKRERERKTYATFSVTAEFVESPRGSKMGHMKEPTADEIYRTQSL